jgi:flagellar motor switch/type III secretory pathway protein FliN
VSAAVSMVQSASPATATAKSGDIASGSSNERAPGSNSEGASEDEEKRWQPVLALPCELTVDLGLPGFKVSDLLKLGPGTVLGCLWPVRRDVPLRVNGNVIGWSEFEVVAEKLAVRLTELA